MAGDAEGGLGRAGFVRMVRGVVLGTVAAPPACVPALAATLTAAAPPRQSGGALPVAPPPSGLVVPLGTRIGQAGVGYPTEGVQVELALDTRRRPVREALTDPSHLDTRTFIHPEEGERRAGVSVHGSRRLVDEPDRAGQGVRLVGAAAVFRGIEVDRASQVPVLVRGRRVECGVRGDRVAPR